MIRVTFKNKHNKVITREFLSMCFSKYKASLVDENLVQLIILKTSIIKFEKQVKDLTLEEILKLGLDFKLSEAGYFLWLYKKDKAYTSMYDYIEITVLVKGEKE